MALAEDDTDSRIAASPSARRDKHQRRHKEEQKQQEEHIWVTCVSTYSQVVNAEKIGTLFTLRHNQSYTDMILC